MEEDYTLETHPMEVLQPNGERLDLSEFLQQCSQRVVEMPASFCAEFENAEKVSLVITSATIGDVRRACWERLNVNVGFETLSGAVSASDDDAVNSDLSHQETDASKKFFNENMFLAEKAISIPSCSKFRPVVLSEKPGALPIPFSLVTLLNAGTENLWSSCGRESSILFSPLPNYPLGEKEATETTRWPKKSHGPRESEACPEAPTPALQLTTPKQQREILPADSRATETTGGDATPDEPWHASVSAADFLSVYPEQKEEEEGFQEFPDDNQVVEILSLRDGMSDILLDFADSELDNANESIPCGSALFQQRRRQQVLKQYYNVISRGREVSPLLSSMGLLGKGPSDFNFESDNRHAKNNMPLVCFSFRAMCVVRGPGDFGNRLFFPVSGVNSARNRNEEPAEGGNILLPANMRSVEDRPTVGGRRTSVADEITGEAQSSESVLHCNAEERTSLSRKELLSQLKEYYQRGEELFFYERSLSSSTRALTFRRKSEINGLFRQYWEECLFFLDLNVWNSLDGGKNLLMEVIEKTNLHCRSLEDCVFFITSTWNYAKYCMRRDVFQVEEGVVESGEKRFGRTVLHCLVGKPHGKLLIHRPNRRNVHSWELLAQDDAVIHRCQQDWAEMLRDILSWGQVMDCEFLGKFSRYELEESSSSSSSSVASPLGGATQPAEYGISVVTEDGATGSIHAAGENGAHRPGPIGGLPVTPRSELLPILPYAVYIGDVLMVQCLLESPYMNEKVWLRNNLLFKPQEQQLPKDSSHAGEEKKKRKKPYSRRLPVEQSILYVFQERRFSDACLFPHRSRLEKFYAGGSLGPSIPSVLGSGVKATASSDPAAVWEEDHGHGPAACGNVLKRASMVRLPRLAKRDSQKELRQPRRLVLGPAPSSSQEATLKSRIHDGAPPGEEAGESTETAPSSDNDQGPAAREDEFGSAALKAGFYSGMLGEKNSSGREILELLFKSGYMS